MTDTPKPPDRRRRKIIVAFVLVFVSLCTWWHWPRGDARFVGDWEVFSEAYPDGPAMFTFRFYRNGSYDSSRKTALTGSSWRVENNELILGSAMPRWAERIAPYLEPAYERLTGGRIWLGVQRWEIVELHDNEIVLENQPRTTSVIVVKRTGR